MNEESILILNMLREGKISAEQADALLRAVRQTIPPPPAAPPPLTAPPPPPAVDPAVLAAMQNKLSDMQNRLGDLQGKLGAAQTARTAAQAMMLAGKVFDHLPKPEIDVSKMFDEAVRGLSSLKNDAVRSAKAAARQAGQDAKQAARQGRKSMRLDLNLGFGDNKETGRPSNRNGRPQAEEMSQTPISWGDAMVLSFTNSYGNITLIGQDDEAMGRNGSAKVTKAAWAASDSEARVLLQQIFLTSRVEHGTCRIEMVAPSAAQDQVTADYEIAVPRSLLLEMKTTFGNIDAQEVSAVLATETISGTTTLRRLAADSAGDARLQSRSGSITVEGWNAPEAKLTAETLSGTVTTGSATCRQASLSSRSGDVIADKIQTVADSLFESVSGDVSVTGGSVGTRAAAKTQSGDVTLRSLRADQLSIETVSGDAHLREITAILTIKTISGGIDAEGIQSTSASLGTVSGDTRWSYAAPFSGSLAGTTVSGDISVTLWTNSDTRVEMNTTSGDLHCGFSLSEKSLESSKQIAGKIGDGIGSLKLQSVSGDINLVPEP